jgi:hypothetical protein
MADSFPKGKQISMSTEGNRPKGGASRGDSESGPTGSPRTYPKGSKIKMDPQAYKSGPATDIYVGGVDPATGRDPDAGSSNGGGKDEY